MFFLLLIFIGAFLLFQVQPLIAKVILPYFGGGASVWTACLLFFQALLLLGYFYAHKLSQLKQIKTQFIIHTLLLTASLFALPIGLSEISLMSVDSNSFINQQPLSAILLQLTFAVGLPYFLLSSTGPLVQRWITFVKQDKLPYQLYSLSNFASLLALVSFPFLFEPLIAASTQSWLWSATYCIYVAVFGRVMYELYVQLKAKGALLRIKTGADETGLGITIPLQLIWAALACVGVILLVATTNAMTQNVPPVPFLWVLPLCLYLLTFIISFHSPKWYVRVYFFTLFSLSALLAIFMFFIGSQFDIVSQIVIYSCILFTACMICHGELARLKPNANGLTKFYFLVSLGGFLGSLFVAFVAQNVFVQFLEFPLAILSVFILFVFASLISSTKKSGLTVVSLTCFIVFSGVFIYVNQLYVKTDIYSARNFYGVLSVKDVEVNGEVERRLIDGTTSHGTQSLTPENRYVPLSYYRDKTGIAIAFSQLRLFKQVESTLPSQLNVGLIGLGAGTLAAYGKTGDNFQFFELNPAVISSAQEYFTYLKDSPANIDIIQGDARVSLKNMLAKQNKSHNDFKAGIERFDLLVVDAFSGDSIPQHLLTLESVNLYFEHLNDFGVLAVHVSNSHLNLLPLMRGLANKQGSTIRYFHSAADKSHQHDTQWVLLSRNEKLMEQTLIKAYQSTWPDDVEYEVLWTDNNSSLLSVLK
ncbi:spermidine synthase [Thalassotalea piscium]|uniref:Integral membrane-like protein n=1 Tax=Thalassotalea piscium TaxID=1230533 RepID=A0A7X0TU04_9GAMM|nr:hypothetical protein [Thalassotalea piscium]MBB6543644.1 hypothetical protein [Thalassotalea piscium]